jgi:CubicO group peptidase (beta-lactamase class C family)
MRPIMSCRVIKSTSTGAPRSTSANLGLLAVAMLLTSACAPASSPSPDDDVSGDDTSSPPVSEPPTQPQRCDIEPARFESIAAQLDKALAANGVPGGAMAIVCNGNLAFTHAAGVKRFGGAEPIRESTRFQLASVTKMFTAATAVSLAESGELDLRAPIGELLPAVGYGDRTLHQLLSHSAGFPTEFLHHDSSELSPLVQANADIPMWAPAGDVFNYSNPGYAVAGAAMEVATGRPFADLVQQHVFDASGMASATMDVSTVLAGDFAFGHSGSEQAPESIAPDGAYFHTGAYGPMGGAWASVTDMARWAEAHMRGSSDGLPPESMAVLRKAHIPTGVLDGQHYGYGLFVDEGLEPTIVSHGGSTPGYLVDFQLSVEAGIAIVVMVNADWFYPGEITTNAIDALVSPRVISAVSPDQQHYVGSYADPHELGTVQVTLVDGRLMANFVTHGFERELTHWYGNLYEVDYPPEQSPIDITFWLDEGQPSASYLVSLWGVAARQ